MCCRRWRRSIITLGQAEGVKETQEARYAIRRGKSQSSRVAPVGSAEARRWPWPDAGQMSSSRISTTLRLEETRAAIATLGRRALAVHCDVSQDADVERLGETALSAMGHVDILMNNAGVVLRGALELIPWRTGSGPSASTSSVWCVAYARFYRTCLSGAAATSSTLGLSPG